MFKQFPLPSNCSFKVKQNDVTINNGYGERENYL